jgi:hypothetical protein
MFRFIASMLALAAVVAGNAAFGQMTFDSAVSYPVGDKPEGGVLFDFNDDGYLDLVVTSENPDKIEFHSNRGDGAFIPAFTLLTGDATSPEGLAVGDFDADADLDLAAALFSDNSVQLILNDGAGSFTLGPTFAIGIEPSIIVAADFNGDGFSDAAVNNRASGDVSVLINDGLGGFQRAVNYPVGIETRCVATGDITGDKLPDLAVSARDSRLVRVFQNIGGGAFQTLIDLSLGSILEPQGIALADFDSDGKLDVVTATSGNELQEHVSVFLQDNFGNPWVGPINGNTGGVSPMGIVAADFDLDGHVDAATANADSNDVGLKKNGGFGIFYAPVVVPVGENPEALVMAAGDLDGNGTDDLVTFNRDSDDVSVLINQTPAPPVIPGDVTGDGSVNVDDLLAVINAWGPCGSSGNCPADLNDDGQVNVDDLLLVINNWG